MKYSALFLILIGMFWSWHISTAARPAGSVVMHQEILTQIEEQLRQAILAKNPNTKDLIFRQLYTEIINPGQELKAHFKIESEEGTEQLGMTDSIFRGSVALTSSDNGLNWKVNPDEFGTQFVRFREGSAVRAGKEENSTEEIASPAREQELAPGLRSESKPETAAPTTTTKPETQSERPLKSPRTAPKTAPKKASSPKN
jgi:hypothetical protein